jgi:hypothetical protein
VNLLVSRAVLPENVPPEHKHRMKAVLVAQSSGPVYQCGKYGMLVGWAMMRASLGRGWYV